MIERLDATQTSLASTARDLARRHPRLRALASLGALTQPAEFDKALLGARLELMRFDAASQEERRAAESDLRAADQALLRAQTSLDGLRKADDACRRIDDWLVRGPTLQSRLDEAFRSLWPKLRPHLDRALDPEDMGPQASGTRRSLLKLGLRPQAVLDSLGPHVEAGVRDWLSYTARKISEDLELHAWQVLNPLERVLAVESPFGGPKGIDPRLALPWDQDSERWWKLDMPPEATAIYEKPRFWSQFGLTLRSQAYMLAGILAIAGLSHKYAMPSAAALLMPLVWYTVRQDIRASAAEHRERAVKELRSQMSEWVQERMERVKVKARDWFAFVLQSTVRRDFRSWYQSTFLPRLQEADRALLEARKVQTETNRKVEGWATRHPGREIESFLALSRPQPHDDED